MDQDFLNIKLGTPLKEFVEAEIDFVLIIKNISGEAITIYIPLYLTKETLSE